MLLFPVFFYFASALNHISHYTHILCLHLLLPLELKKSTWLLIPKPGNYPLMIRK